MARIYFILALLLFLTWAPFNIQAAVQHHDYISQGFLGSPMTYVDYSGEFLTSLNLNFSLCFHNQGESYYLSIIHKPSQRVIWIANRDKPISLSDNLSFASNGNLTLINSTTNEVIWSSNTLELVDGVTKMQMQDNGNLAIMDNKNKTLWQSFDHPTDTLLSGQILRNYTKLVSKVSSTDFSSGPYSLSLASNKDLCLMYSSGSDSDMDLSFSYWSMSKDANMVNLSNGSPSYVELNPTGFSLMSNEGTVISEYRMGCTSLCMVALDPSGNLIFSVFSSNLWTPVYQAPTSNCDLPLYCGPLGLCSGGQCSCPGPLQEVNKENITQGCTAPSVGQCLSNNSSVLAPFQKISDNVDYFENKYVSPIKTDRLDECQEICSANCSCNFFFFNNVSTSCYTFSKLGTLKSGTTSGVVLYARSMVEDIPSQSSSDSKEFPRFVLPLIIVGSVLIIIFMTSIFLYWYCKMRKINLSGEEAGEEDLFLDVMPGFPRRFTFKDLQIATNNFSKRLGGGGFGSVYEGALNDKSKVAVKQLEGIGQGKKEFRAEVEIIGSIHHCHLVQLRGFCAEGPHRLLVYEYMINGSLDKHLFYGVKSNVLDWNTRIKIALGTARGLAYLHEDCRDKVIHCDIKPENILLDDNFNAKLSDFGLAKLMNKEQSQVFTTMRGTRGYLAPEWIMNLPISEKSDVYSFGMVLLELVGGRKNFEPSEVSEKRYFPAYAFDQIERGSPEELIDKKLNGRVNDDFLRVVRIALWCIQEETSLRPSMARIVQMLEGSAKIEEPPSSATIQVHARMIETFTSSQASSTTSGSTNHLSQISSVQLSGPR